MWKVAPENENLIFCLERRDSNDYAEKWRMEEKQSSIKLLNKGAINSNFDSRERDRESSSDKLLGREDQRKSGRSTNYWEGKRDREKKKDQQ